MPSLPTYFCHGLSNGGFSYTRRPIHPHRSFAVRIIEPLGDIILNVGACSGQTTWILAECAGPIQRRRSGILAKDVEALANYGAVLAQGVIFWHDPCVPESLAGAAAYAFIITFWAEMTVLLALVKKDMALLSLKRRDPESDGGCDGRIELGPSRMARKALHRLLCLATRLPNLMI